MKYICDIAREFSTSKAILSRVSKLNILVRENKDRVKKTEYITDRDYELLKDTMKDLGKCSCCGVKFNPKTFLQKYCSKKCRVKQNTLNYKNGVAVSKRESNGDFIGANHSYATKKGKEEARKILTCSVDCLIEELGDIE